MKPSPKQTIIRRLQQSRFIGQPLLPVLLNDPNLHAVDPLDLDQTRSRSSLREAVAANLFQNYTKLVKSDANPSTVELKKSPDTRDSSTLRRLLKTFWCPQVKTCAQMRTEEEKLNATRLSTGHCNLDRLLDGGLRTNEIVELLGKSATGKTQLCLNTCAAVLKQYPDRTVLYLDTKGDFSPHHLEQLLYSMFRADQSESHQLDGPNSVSSSVASCLLRIRVALVPTIDRLIDALVETRIALASKLPESGSMGSETNPPSFTSNQQSSMFYQNLILVVVDSLAAPFVPYMGPLPQLAKSQLAVAVVELQRIAIFLHCSVLVVNHLRASRPTDPVDERRNLGCLGVGWAAVPHKRLNLAPSRNREAVKSSGFQILVTLSRDVSRRLPCASKDVPPISCTVTF